MRFLKRMAAGLCITSTAVVAFLWWASQPAIDPSQLPLEAVHYYATDAAARPHRRSIRLVTYNIGYAYGDKNNTGTLHTKSQVEAHLNQMIAALRALDPDVIGLQEVDFAAYRTHGIDQLAYLAKGLQMPFAAHVVTWNRRYVPWPYWPPPRHFRQVVSGQAMVSRYPIVHHTTHWFEKPADNPFWYNLFYLDRVAQRITIRIGDRDAVVWHAHLEAFDDSTRGRQLQIFAEQLRAETTPWVWALGDFNSASDDPALQDFAQLTQLRNVEGPTMTASFPSWEPTEKIDHIFARPNQSILAAGILKNIVASDHLPVWAEFRLR